MAGIIPAPVPAGRLGWSGQPTVALPASIVPGAGLVGRTVGSQLFLDASSDATAEAVSMCAPGAVAAKTIGRWRNRRTAGQATLTVLEANLVTPPTAGDAANYWKVLVTDANGTNVALPISTNGARFYDLDRSAGVAIIDPWSGQYPLQNGGDSPILGQRIAFSPNQGMVLGSFDAQAVTREGVGAAALVAKRVRGMLWREEANGSMTELTRAYAFTTAGAFGSHNDRLTFRFPFTVPVTAGTKYHLTVDLFEDYDPTAAVAGCYYMVALTPDGFGVTPNGGQPVNLNPAGDVNIAVMVDNNPVGGAAAAGAAVRALTWQSLATTKGAVADNGVYSIKVAFFSAFVPTIYGTLSGVAPVYGDLTFSVAAQGAPVAGAAGTDLNLRAVLQP